MGLSSVVSWLESQVHGDRSLVFMTSMVPGAIEDKCVGSLATEWLAWKYPVHCSTKPQKGLVDHPFYQFKGMGTGGVNRSPPLLLAPHEKRGLVLDKLAIRTHPMPTCSSACI